MESMEKGKELMYELQKDKAAAAKLKLLLSGPNGKTNLYNILKACSAMKLQREDSVPSLVLCLQEDGSLVMGSEGTPFLY